MVLFAEFPGTDDAEAAALAVRAAVPLVWSTTVRAEEKRAEPETDFAFFPINSIAPGYPSGNYYPALFAYNAWMEPPPFEPQSTAVGKPPEPETRETATLAVCADERYRRNIEAICAARGGKLLRMP